MASDAGTGLISFLRAIWTKWFSAMSGPLSVPAAIAAPFIENQAIKISLALTAFVCAWAAAYAVWRLERERVLALTEEMERLTAPRRPLNVEIGKDGPFVSIKARGPNGIGRTYNLRILNQDRSKPITSCRASIVDIAPGPALEKLPWALTDYFSLASGDDIYVPLASFGEAREPEKYPCADTLIQVRSPQPDNWFLIDTTEHILKIRVTSHDSGHCEISCKLWVDSHGKFQIERV